MPSPFPPSVRVPPSVALPPAQLHSSPHSLKSVGRAWTATVGFPASWLQGQWVCVIKRSIRNDYNLYFLPSEKSLIVDVYAAVLPGLNRDVVTDGPRCGLSLVRTLESLDKYAIFT